MVVVPAGWVVVLLSVVPPPVPVPSPVPPLSVVELVTVFELELLEDDKLDELELFEVALDPVFEAEVPPPVEDLFEPEPVEVVAVDGVAALVVGIVSVGAPAVSLGPLPLPPQAARTRAASTAAPLPKMARDRRLRTGSCIRT